MSDEEKADAEGSNKKKSKLVLILIVVNVLTLGGFAAFVTLGNDSNAEASEEVAKAPAGEAKDGDEKTADEDDKTPSKEEDAPKSPAGDGDVGPTAMVGKFTINLADRAAARYLRVVINVEVDSEDTATELKKRNAQLRYIAIAYLSGLSRKDTQGPAALDEIRDSLLRRFNHVLTKGVVKQVYFTDFVTQ